VTGSVLLDWAIITVSLLNAILQLWLGLTVLLNADRRTRGVWMMGSGLLFGAAFFVSHTAILGHELSVTTDGLNFWWQIGWIPVTLAPFAWYIVSLWYAGFWNTPKNRLQRRHRVWFVVVCLQAGALLLLLVFARLVPAYNQIIQLDLSGTMTVGDVPILFLLFPAFMMLCIALAIDALLHPEPSERVMGEIARQRSRPWLMATAVVLLAVSLLVTFFIFRVVSSARENAILEITIRRIGAFDLALSALVAIATISLGQAIVSYEVFTGKALPRRGFFRQWRNTLLIASGYAFLIGWSLANQVRPIYSLILTALLMVVFYALLSWRSFVEREQFMAQLRPFVSSQRLIKHLVNTQEEASSRANELFQAVCQNVLGTDRAQLIPLGILAPLVGPPLTHPQTQKFPGIHLSASLFSGAGSSVIALDPAQYAGLQWAIPLWAERGLIGALLVGAKRDGGLYTQEEIEIAGASGERIIDMLAGEQMAQRLMQLQRKRQAENRVMDFRTRRVLHDETLPTLHAAALRLSGLSCGEPVIKDAINALTEVHQQIADLIYSAHTVANNAHPDIIKVIKETIHKEYSNEFTTILLHIPDNLSLKVDALTHEATLGAIREVVRNAAIHGRGEKPDRPLNLNIEIRRDDELSIIILDDGVGLETRVPTESRNGGSGGGLALHSTMLAIVGGYLLVEPGSDGGTQVTITVPFSL
jgi:two-component sensor histidine kinase